VLFGVALGVILFFWVWAFFLRERGTLQAVTRASWWGGILSLAIGLGTVVLAQFRFSDLFFGFHQVVFRSPQSEWYLNPASDNLKILLPDSFFFDATSAIILLTMVESLVLVAVLFWPIRRWSLEEKNK